MTEDRAELEAVNAEMHLRHPEWWYMMEEGPAGVAISLGPMADIDDTIYLRMPLPTAHATLLRAGLAAAECRDQT